jgi:hypothetical protein
MARNFRDPGAVTLDYNKQPYPLFGVWDNYNGTTYGLNVFDSDYQPVSRTTVGNYNGLGTELATLTTTTTNTQASSSAGFIIKGTSMQGVDGCIGMAANNDGTYTFRSPTTVAAFWPSFGVVIGPEGYRQNFSLHNTNRAVSLYSRGTSILLDTLTLVTVTHGTFATANTTRGTTCYNRNTNTLVLMEANDATGLSYRIHIWKNTTRKITGRPNDLSNFITEAKAGTNGGTYQYFDFSWSPNAATTAEPYQRARVISCNNGKIVISRMINNTRIEMCTLTPATDGSNTGTFLYRTNTVSATTNYGVDQGNQFGIRHNITWDNRWVAVFTTIMDQVYQAL